MIDIHSHIIPNVDDGSQGVKETFSIINEAIDVGFTEIITTSHYIQDYYDIKATEREELIEAIQSKLNSDNMKIRLYNGAEVFIFDKMTQFIKEGIIPTLAESRYVLFEIPMQSKTKAIYMDDQIMKLIGNNYVPIIAHPERYQIIQENPNLALEWIKKGALLQANYGSILGSYGEKSKSTVIKLFNANAIHFLGTDVHRVGGYKKVEEAMQRLEKTIGKEKLEQLSYINPKKIISNEEIEIEEPKKIRKSLFGN